MCGRIALIKPDKKNLKQRFPFLKQVPKLAARYNISPGQDIPVILNCSPDELTFARWGLIPHWAKEEKLGYKMINAKAETIMEKPSYRGPFKNKRCLIIVDTFFEWKRANGKKPYRIMMKDESPFALAGIWDRWEKMKIISCSILTTGPNALIKKIHDRMPVILAHEKEEVWLSESPQESLLPLLKPFAASAMQTCEISKLVNSPANDVPEVIRPLK